MAYYKIKNITGDLAKRHQNKDSEVKIEYLVGFQKKIYALQTGQELVLSCKSLPVQIHGMRAKKLVTVIEISENEFMKLQKPSAKKTSNTEPVVEVTTTKAPETENDRKKSTQKKKGYSTTYFKSDNE